MDIIIIDIDITHIIFTMSEKGKGKSFRFHERD